MSAATDKNECPQPSRGQVHELVRARREALKGRREILRAIAAAERLRGKPQRKGTMGGRPRRSRALPVHGEFNRSIMAEAILNTLGEGRLKAFSAGSHPLDECIRSRVVCKPCSHDCEGFTTTFAGITINHVRGIILAQFVGAAASMGVCAWRFNEEGK